MKTLELDYLPKDPIAIKQILREGVVLEVICDINLNKRYLVRYSIPTGAVLQDWFFACELEPFPNNE
jgi:hypothetical protein